MKKGITLTIIGLILTFVVSIAITLISFSNTEVTLKNRFEAKLDERTSFYDQMHKIISQKVQISNKVDESFKDNINTIMEGRKDSEQVMFKWITESNPNANFDQVSILYQELSRTIEAKRTEFFMVEKGLADINREYKNLTNTFPNSMYFSILGKTPISYKPIQSTLTEQVMKTGKDDNIKLEL